MDVGAGEDNLSTPLEDFVIVTRDGVLGTLEDPAPTSTVLYVRRARGHPKIKTTSSLIGQTRGSMMFLLSNMSGLTWTWCVRHSWSGASPKVSVHVKVRHRWASEVGSGESKSIERPLCERRKISRNPVYTQTRGQTSEF